MNSRHRSEIKEHIANTRDKRSEDHISNFSSDLDDPYHETATSWFHRDILRRVRRSAGASSEDESSTGSEGVQDLCKGDDLSSAKEFAIASATRKFDAWLGTYPIAASKCCLSAATTFGKSTTVETKRLKRIFRRMRRKEKEFRHTETRTCSTYHQKTNSISAEAMLQIHTESSSEREYDKLAIQSFLPQGTGISFVDSILARAEGARSSKKDDEDDEQFNWPILELVRVTMEVCLCMVVKNSLLSRMHHLDLEQRRH